MTASSSGVHLSIQRYRGCKLLLCEREWKTVGQFRENESKLTHCGLLVYISFTNEATYAKVEQAASAVLQLPVCTRGLWGDAQSTTSSIAELAANGDTSVVIVPQANLICRLKGNGKSIQYHGQLSDRSKARRFYRFFCDSLRAKLLEEQCLLSKSPLPSWYNEWKQRHDEPLIAETAVTTQTTNNDSHIPSAFTSDPSMPPEQIYPYQWQLTSQELNRTSVVTDTKDTKDAKDEAPSSTPPIDTVRFDVDTGLPLTDYRGKPLTKSAIKKIHKVYNAHRKRHEKWKAQQQNSPSSSTNATKSSESTERKDSLTATSVSSTMTVIAPSNSTMDKLSLQTSSFTLDDSPAPPQTFHNNDRNNKNHDQEEHYDQLFDQALTSTAILCGTFGKRQGIEIASDMGPFSHVFQV